MRLRAASLHVGSRVATAQSVCVIDEAAGVQSDPTEGHDQGTRGSIGCRSRVMLHVQPGEAGGKHCIMEKKKKKDRISLCLSMCVSVCKNRGATCSQSMHLHQQGG